MTQPKNLINIGVVVIGDGHLGVSSALAFAEYGLDVLVIGPPTNNDMDLQEEYIGAGLRNQSLFQSGILPLLGKNPKRIKDGLDSYFAHLKDGRDKMVELCKPEKIIGDEPGTLQYVPKLNRNWCRTRDEAISQYQDLVKHLRWDGEYEQPLNADKAKELIEDFVEDTQDENAGVFFPIPDRPFNGDRALSILRARAVDGNENPRLGNIFFFNHHSKDPEISTTELNQDKDGPQYRFEISGLDDFIFHTYFLVVCAGKNTLEIAKKACPIGTQITSNAKNKGLCISSISQQHQPYHKTPFFARSNFRDNEFLFSVRHSTSWNGPSNLFVTSNGEHFRLAKPIEGSSYIQIKTENEPQINKKQEKIRRQFEAITKGASPNPQVRDNSFCIHISGSETNYAYSIESFLNDQLVLAHPGLATGSISVGQMILDRFKDSPQRPLFWASQALSSQQKRRLFISVTDNHSEILRRHSQGLERSFFREPRKT